MAAVEAPAAAAVLAAPSLLTPHEHRPQRRRHLLHVVLVLAVANRHRGRGSSGRRRRSRRPRVAKPPWATSGRAEASGGCVRAPWCSPAPQPPTTCLLRPDSASSDDLPVQNPVRDLLLEFDEVQGPNCEVSDSCE